MLASIIGGNREDSTTRTNLYTVSGWRTGKDSGLRAIASPTGERNLRMVVALECQQGIHRCKGHVKGKFCGTFRSKLIAPSCEPLIPVPAASCCAVPAPVSTLHDRLKYIKVREQQIGADVTRTETRFDVRVRPTFRNEKRVRSPRRFERMFLQKTAVPEDQAQLPQMHVFCMDICWCNPHANRRWTMRNAFEQSEPAK